MLQINNETPVTYGPTYGPLPQSPIPPMPESEASLQAEDMLIARAMEILKWRMREQGEQFDTPKVASKYLRLKLGNLDYEEFHVLFLDVHLKLIEDRMLGLGSLTEAPVYPREVVKAALATNAYACILCHNHPGGDCTPSRPDKVLTTQLQEALDLVGVRVLDHMIVSGDKVYSFGEHKLI